MAKISKQDIDYIFENIDIVSLVSEYIKLEKRGQNYLGLCPFHLSGTVCSVVGSVLGNVCSTTGA